MMTKNALNLAFTYLNANYNDDELVKLCEAMRVIAREPNFNFEAIEDQKAYSYDGIQDMLSKLNEKESIRKKKGVYYTPLDLVNFILKNCIKSLYGKLNPENISCPDLGEIPYKSFCKQKTIFDPTCGAGEFLLAATNVKLTLWREHTELTSKATRDIIASIKGNDINLESVIITELRLFLCAINRCKIKSYEEIAEVLNSNFTTYDFVTDSPEMKEQFHIIIGNPPYVEDSKSGIIPNVKYGNIYANVLKNASDRLETNGSMGFVIPLSYISTPRMQRIRSDLFATLPEQYILSYADRPDCLFDSVHQKLCVLIGKNKKSERTVYTSNYHYWYKEERKKLFHDVQVIKNPFWTDSFIPKLGNEYDRTIFKKISTSKKNDSVYEMSRQGTESVYLNRRETFWMKAFRTFVDDPEYKVFNYNTTGEADYCYCLINSSLFWWYWICVSDCWHVSKELNGFKAPKISNHEIFTELAQKLRDKLEETKVYVGTRQTEYEYKHKMCLSEIHEIDDLVNTAFDLSDEESAYVKGFAFKYRTSGGTD
ncbi:Eco57I restriction-modification methylase domain-containing protein [Aminipila sp.]|uniref:Eco57I restriction-modification methylase domain-containing protein n=1 Tax=Aminipila sp. TaxID=2060095 RepID=UPI00289790D2|nr:N-6 DNA methylase [Aminipila sp.]